jgi:acyl-CoA dehydrogenase
LIGEVDRAWMQATGELAYERSGPERFLETIFVLYELIRAAGEHPDIRVAEGVGRLTAEQLLPGRARDLLPPTRTGANSAFEQTLMSATLVAPKLTIQGGTREILRGIIARGLGLR